MKVQFSSMDLSKQISIVVNCLEKVRFLKGFFPLNQGPMVYTEKDHFNYFHTVGLACD